MKMLNSHLDNFLNSLTDESVTEFDNMCNLKLININKQKLKYTFLLYNSLYPSINTIHFIKNISKYNYDISYLKKLIDNPFLHPSYENSTKSYLYYLKNKTNNIYESKIFWNNFFLKYNANTPTIKAIVINGNVITNYSSILKLLEHNKNNPNKILNVILKNIHDNGGHDIINKDINNYDTIFKNSIIKPNYGRQGTDIKVYQSQESIPKKEGIFLIQQKVKNINYNGHFRIITYYNKEKNIHEQLYTYLFIQEDKTKIQSNAHRGATLYQVKHSNVRKMSEKTYNMNIQDFNYSYSLLKKSIMKAIELHKKLDAIIIGWDVKITDKNYYFLEGNFGPGNIFFNDYYYLDKLDFVTKIKYD